MNVLGLITARGGSKSIPGKNIKSLSGKPLIAWTIEAAQQCRELKRIIVSTDDVRIADVSRQWGAEIPFLRPRELAEDDSSHISVVLHALQWLKDKERFIPDYVMLLQPTSPFRAANDVKQAIQLAEDQQAVAVVSVCKAGRHPYLCKRILKDGTLADFYRADIEYLQRQKLPPAYDLNGAIYLNQRISLLRDGNFLPDGTLAYVMPPERSIDVDTPWDWHIAELLLKERHGAD